MAQQFCDGCWWMDKQKDAFHGKDGIETPVLATYKCSVERLLSQFSPLPLANCSLLECWAVSEVNNDDNDGNNIPDTSAKYQITNVKWQLMVASLGSVMATSSWKMAMQPEGIAVGCKLTLFYSAHWWLCSSHFWRSPWQSPLVKIGKLFGWKWVSFIVLWHTSCIAAAISGEAPGSPFMLKIQTLLVAKLSLLTA